MCKQQLCPKCIGAKEVMEARADGKKGFQYKDCNLCNGKGYVNPVLASDFELSLNEDNLETNEDW